MNSHRKKLILLVLSLSTLLPLACFAAGDQTIDFSPVYSNTDANNFLAGVLARLRSIIGFLAVLFILIGGVLYVTSAGSEKMVRAAKGFWTSAILGVAIAFAAPSFLLEIKKILFNGGLPADPTQVPGLTEIVSRALTFLLSIVGSLAIIGLVISGLMFITSGINKGQADQAKKALQASLIGIVVASLSLVLVKQIALFVSN